MGNHLGGAIAQLLTHGPAAVPVWAALGWIVLLFYRKTFGNLVCRACRIIEPEAIDQILAKVDVPCQFLLITLAVLPFLALFTSSWAPFLVKFASFAAAFLTVHLLLTGIDIMACRSYQRRRNLPVPAVLRFTLLSLLYMAVVLLFADWLLGVNVLPVLATSSVIAAVLGLALQDTLRNVFAGLTITLEKSVKQGDWISFHLNNEHRFGQVMEIGWRSTKVKTANNTAAIVPNVLLVASELINYHTLTESSGKVIDFPVTIKADPESVIRTLSRAASQVSGILLEPAPQVCAREVKSDVVVYQLRFWMAGIEKEELLTSAVISTCWQGLSGLMAVLPGE